MRQSVLASVCLLLPALAHGEAGPLQLAADLNPESGVSWPFPEYSELQSLGDKTVYLREDENPPALWVTDGTADGTKALATLCRWSCHPEALGSDGRLAFYATSVTRDGGEFAVWRTDGTVAGTYPLTAEHLSPGHGHNEPFHGGLLGFSVQRPPGPEIWLTDGSVAGTRPAGLLPSGSWIASMASGGEHAVLLVRETGDRTFLWSASRSGLERLRETPDAGRLYSLGDGRALFLTHGEALTIWVSDGTAAGTRPLASHDPSLRFVDGLLLGRRFYFKLSGSPGGSLWRLDVDGGGETHLADQPAEAGWFNAREILDRLVFTSYQPGTGSTLQSVPLDGSGPITPLQGCLDGCPESADGLASIAPDRSVLYAGGAVAGLWRTDGTGPGTALLQPTGPAGIAQSCLAGSHAVFDVLNDEDDGDLWITDGTAAGSFFVVRGGPGWSHYSWAGRLECSVAGKAVVFPGKAAAGVYGQSLWRSDGTPSGTSLLHDSTALGQSSHPRRLASFQDGLLAEACAQARPSLRYVPRPGHGEPVVLLNGPEGSGCPSRLVSQPVVLGSTAVFLLYGEDDGHVSLWRTDGTAKGTQALYSAAGSRPRDVVRWGDGAAFWVSSGPNRTIRSELWVTDGTPQGTHKRFELPRGTEMLGLTPAAGRLLFFDRVFRGSDTFVHVQPWSSDGTLSGTRPLTRTVGLIEDEEAFRDLPRPFVEAGGRTYFLLGGVDGPGALWRTDGTPGGTEPAVRVDSPMASPFNLRAAGGRLYFVSRRAGLTGVYPWSSDGTEAGTELLARARLDPFDWDPSSRFVELNGKVYFAAADAAHGQELWRTDGTAAGTERFLDLAPGLLGSAPDSLVAWNGRLFFVAQDALHGRELWSSDGTREGTGLVQDLEPGASWSAPADLTPTEHGLYLSAYDFGHGRELWLLPAGLTE
jgi:ELWxxDGT repeat protein